MPNFDFVAYEFGNDCLPQRFWNKVKVNPETGCWEWTACKFNTGYGYYWLDGGGTSGHRAAYEAFRGVIPEGLHLDHLCRVRNCVNPAHLEAVTPTVNILRGTGITAHNAKKDRCPTCDGEFTQYKENKRYCAHCRKEAIKNWRTRNREEGRTLRDIMGDEAYEARLKRQNMYYRIRKQRALTS